MTAAPPAENGEQRNGDGTVFGPWCSWHKGAAPSRPVAVIERGPGAGGTLYACRPCRIEHKLTTIPTTLARAALLDHLGGTADTKPCGPCNRFEHCPDGDALRANLKRQHKADK